MSEQGLSDRERMFNARRFFWEMMDTLDQRIVTLEEAQRAIKKIAEALPPFTKLKDAGL